METANNPPSIVRKHINIIIVPTRNFLSLNNSTSSNGVLPFLFLLISRNAKINNALRPKTISIMLLVISSVNDKIPKINKTRPINEIIAPVISN